MNTEAGATAPVLILAIETSCDETSVAVVKDGCEVLANIISSQIETHRAFGGVVPEVASRKHVEVITLVIEEAMAAAGVQPEELTAIAVTQGPGLVGALLVGVVAAKSLALAWGKPLIGTHHIAGHIYANRLVKELQYPCMTLVVSGGHTELVNMEREGEFRIIGRTRDDAVGEAYDKVARALGFPYPGGPHVDRLAHEAEEAVALPRVWLEPDSYDFSFSGLKSAVLNVVNQSKMKGLTPDVAGIARGFQESVVEVLVEKAVRAVKANKARQLLLCGGVAANKGLREALVSRCEKEGIELIIPPAVYCTDNAAMIGAAAYVKWRHDGSTPLDMVADPGLSLEQWSVSAY
ncbi:MULTISPECIES: tRNA (adenosine(37)-N6)-threonylcarbamoyltransferase complex transferase subunit TsaD [unclassified Paenibacillus]|uniref:tRNA (adenosine(37)-N6)-threonylcarbamoyltransferase complex transferase subunit TsaD n=1 Tax=unclassified Paenibacillus TaxID=185978 RepID=UPI002405F374|nr:MULTISPECIES: tRNA (adenosine(37)-N6)-threonylcarbamoyltransferase complex transferase subunit TsaD [unclassified Paenibacillus]MDF9842359.1 N6-L-threonylcarbamoyladenine synthase [Paenibacillus sp. PastF-2]MDF9848949.1 N6-L-threonylcarbamoyladenine synthase [Paenibacillus sp. PastM-2]MDF9855519.1 N6-L-threonylcarbamoyladenine synthase [Paenibacillus sp. PastF-1]MDH6480791.1 N6-L-threonylcarbamoyladenine synthase [Paenibacillus sp. PastH-2]MDH6508213.1 N6-L-threonylcarbamoyladenine synthase